MGRADHHGDGFYGFVRSLGQRKRPAQSRRKPSPSWLIESLEDRTLLSSFTVSNISDDGAVAGSLRNAINQANANPGFDTIEFDFEFFFTPRVITLSGTELEIT